MGWFITDYAGQRMPVDPSIARLRARQRSMASGCVQLLRETRQWLAAGNIKKAVEWWGASQLLQGGADGCHDRLLTFASARVRDELLAHL